MAKRHTSDVDDLVSVVVRLEELVLASSGADEFEEILKLVLAKVWDEHCGAPSRFARDRPGSAKARMATLLQEAGQAWPGVLEGLGPPVLGEEHLDVCMQSMAGRRLATSDLAVLDGLFEVLVGRVAKGAKGQFFTPRGVIELAVQMLAPRPGESVVDPACGSGGFLLHAASYARAGSEDGELRAWGFDIDGRALRIGRILLALAGVEATLTRVNSLVRDGIEAIEARLHAGPGRPPPAGAVGGANFDVLLTNPPFAGEVREPSLLASYELGQGRSRIERDVLFVERCLDLVRPGGRLAMVLPHNKLAGEGFAFLRRWLLQRARVLAVVGLHRDTFLPHTHQKAGLLLMSRRREGERPSMREPIFFAISEQAGKTSTGKPTGQSDFASIVQQYHRFRQAGLAGATAASKG